MIVLLTGFLTGWSFAQKACFRVVMLLSLVITCGCWGTSSATKPLSGSEVEQFARRREPSELIERITLGEEACGGKEAKELLRAAYWLKRKDYSSSLRSVADVSPSGSFRKTAIWIAGEDLYHLGDLVKSIELLSTAVAEDADDFEAHRALAMAYFDISAMNQAEIELRHMIRLSPSDYRPYHLLGRIHLDFKKHAEAIDDFQNAIKLCKNASLIPELQRGLGLSLIGERRFDDALNMISTDETDPVLLTCRADALWSKGRTDEATKLLEQIPKPVPVEGLFLSARIAIDQGRNNEALEWLRELLTRDPHDVAARYQLAHVQRQLGDVAGFEESMRLKEESQKLIDQLIDLNEKIVNHPGDPALCDEISDVCQKLGKERLAETWRKAAMGLRQSAIRNAAPSGANDKTSN